MGGRPLKQNHNPVIGGRVIKDTTENLRERADAQRAQQRAEEQAVLGLEKEVAELKAQITFLQDTVSELEADKVALATTNAKLSVEVDKLKKKAVGKENAELDNLIKDEDLELDKRPAMAKKKPAPKVSTKNQKTPQKTEDDQKPDKEE